MYLEGYVYLSPLVWFGLLSLLFDLLNCCA